MKNTLNLIGGVITALLLLDAMAFMLWILSGQVPVGSIYFGAITASIVRAFLGL